jgi:hypothetical protein
VRLKLNGDSRTILAWIIVVVWLVALLVCAITGNTTVLSIATPVMLIVSGFLFWRPNRDGKPA